MQNLPKYDFRGFRLLKANVNRVKDSQLTSFSLFAQKGVYNEENKIYELISEITVTFGEEVNVFVFSAGFKINDPEWLEVMAEQTILGAIAYTKDEFRTCIELMEEKQIDVLKFLSKTVSLDEVQGAYEELTSGKSDSIKILVDPRK